MKNAPGFTWGTLLGLLLVLSCAAGARVWYVMVCADSGLRSAALEVQGDYPRLTSPQGATHRQPGQPSELDNLVANISEHRDFKGFTPLFDKEEMTAHMAPGYPWLFAMAAECHEPADQVMRWGQCALGSLTAALYFLFARRAFHNTFVAILTGLLAAVYPFWIVNITELNDGVLVGFLLAACLTLGTRASQTRGALSSLVFGLALAALTMVRAALLPFALAALVWFLWRCRYFAFGWYAGILVLAGFANVAPWILRDHHLYDRPVPISTTTYYHLWMGNNPAATGGTLDEATMRATLMSDRLKLCLDETNQAKRYDLLADEFWHEVGAHPGPTVARRYDATLAFMLGEHGIKEKSFVKVRTDDTAEMPAQWLRQADIIFAASLLVLFALAFLGWRWSHGWRHSSRLAATAVLWIPMPYILSHAEALSGPRLPLDGVLLCYAGYGLASLIPGAVRDREPAK